MAGGRTRIPTYNCTYCPAKYLSQNGVDAHKAKEHGDGSYIPPPAPLPTIPNSYNQMQNGGGYTGRKKIPDYKCPQCPIKYLSQSGVENHLVRVHGAEGSGNAPPAWTPPVNNYTPRQRSSTFNCNQCIKKYLSQDGLDQHVEREHGGNGGQPASQPAYQPRKRTSTFNCTQCIKKYLSQDGLDAHVKKEHKPAEEEESNEDGLSWPPEKGSIIATLFEDNFYIGRVLRLEQDNSAMVRYMERAKKSLNTTNEDRNWVWPENHETFQTAQESVLGVDLIIEKDEKLSSKSETIFELKDHETWTNLAQSCKSQD